MVWFKVDDTLAFHEKAVAAGNAAMGLWVRAGSWCAQQLTDGFIPDHIIAALGTKGQASRLVGARLWLREDGGYRFHQWGEDGRQPTREEVESKRSEWREKKRQQRRNGAGQYEMSPAVSLGDTPGDSRESPAVPSRPVPSRPKEKNSEGGSHVSSGPVRARPPLFPQHCDRHADVAEPGNCGGCADARKAHEFRTAGLPRHLAVVSSRPDWCGTCNEFTRQLETPVGVIRCPACHPLAEEAS